MTGDAALFARAERAITERLRAASPRLDAPTGA
jgi:hypothetical protein